MRFSKLAIFTAAFLAVNSFQQGQHNAVLAEEVPVAAADPAVLEDSEKFEFQAEVSRMLDIVVNSLYQNKDVFLRELISNSSDALDKIRFLGISKPEMLADKAELEIRIEFDDEKKTLTITDSGIGMTKKELIENLGTVARSGTTKFMEALQEGAGDISQIGMFGVGFYSSFLVADRVTVASKHPHEETQYIWSSENGQDTFYISEDSRGNTLGRGTEITLHLKEDAEEYLSDFSLEKLISHYSEFVTHPIYLRKKDVSMVPEEDEEVPEEAEKEGDDTEDEIEVGDEEDGEEKESKMKEVVTYSWEKKNADTAIWTRSKSDVKDEEYQAFYKSLNKDEPGSETKEAASWSHFDAEGNINFKSLVYIPDEIPNALLSGNFDDFKGGVKLYVRKVLISDSFALLPRYMSFVKGVVDSDDLPLNVNRETLQESKIISIIRKKVTRKVIEVIQKLAEKEVTPEIDEEGNEIEDDSNAEHPYLTWYKKFSPSLKMGIMDADTSNQKKLAKLLRFKTTKSNGEFKSFAEYVDGMPEWQKEIFYIAGSSEKDVESSPFLDKFFDKDVEVLYFTDPADEFMINHLREFDSKKFTTITKETLKFGDEDTDLTKRTYEAYMDKFRPLIKFMQKFYGPAIMRAHISSRLTKIPAIASSSDFGQTANMERLMKSQGFAHGQDDMRSLSRRTLEINPRHPIITKILSQIPEDTDEIDFTTVDQALKDSLWNLLDTALLNGGYPLHDSKGYTNRMIRTLQRELDLDSLELEPEIEPKVIEEEPDDVDLSEHDGINIDDFDLDGDEFGDEL